MARRAGYTEVQKDGQQRPDYVRGMGDTLFKHFQCLSAGCQNFVTVKVSDIGDPFSIACPACGFELRSGAATKFFDYRLVHIVDDRRIESGEFVVLHDDYVAEAKLYKYCILCYTLKPVELFSRHRARLSGYQGECQACKTVYNGIKNQTRITDQHREAAQRRRLYHQLAAGVSRIDSRVVFDKFQGTCFNCDEVLHFAAEGKRGFDLDHTLPAHLLWPMSTANATLLCCGCNNEKHGEWPSRFYDAAKLRRLAMLTGYPYDLLAGPPQMNREAVESIRADVDAFLEAWIPYPADIRKVRRLILTYAGLDIFSLATHLPRHLREAAADQYSTK